MVCTNSCHELMRNCPNMCRKLDESSNARSQVTSIGEKGEALGARAQGVGLIYMPGSRRVVSCTNSCHERMSRSQAKWELPSVEEREVSEKERQTLNILREQRGVTVPPNHRWVAACCIVLQRVAACCSVLQLVATCCSVLLCAV